MKKLGCGLIVAIVAVMLFLINTRATVQENAAHEAALHPQPAPVPAAPKKATKPADFDGREATQRDRLQFVQKIAGQGYWTGTELFGSLPKVNVTEKFFALDRKTQNKFLGVVYAYWMGKLDDFGQEGDVLAWTPLILKMDDGTPNGRRVGSYNPVNGLEQ
jgi:hypothetical protein